MLLGNTRINTISNGFFAKFEIFGDSSSALASDLIKHKNLNTFALLFVVCTKPTGRGGVTRSGCPLIHYQEAEFFECQFYSIIDSYLKRLHGCVKRTEGRATNKRLHPRAQYVPTSLNSLFKPPRRSWWVVSEHTQESNQNFPKGGGRNWNARDAEWMDLLRDQSGVWRIDAMEMEVIESVAGAGRGRTACT
ncbi:hypothetical protein K469DRAFT_774808 [Zopfia rhizophila CBS 207.26]|uniref:Uncharacterized protein n=1 Tax=Zopfia rhizophila CBS 207.26 TaxID=1314779 RepID=A0A6A6EXI9_9PEZI|nr:hypothetical protein K469DRAFT_774808 [Zopfia rhizophila CBS 207.26]